MASARCSSLIKSFLNIVVGYLVFPNAFPHKTA